LLAVAAFLAGSLAAVAVVALIATAKAFLMTATTDRVALATTEPDAHAGAVFAIAATAAVLIDRQPTVFGRAVEHAVPADDHVTLAARAAVDRDQPAIFRRAVEHAMPSDHDIAGAATRALIALLGDD